MTHVSHRFLFCAISLSLLTSQAWSDDLPDATQIEWGISAGVNRYQEKGLMQLQGPEMGVHAKLNAWNTWPEAQLEADVLLGKQQYTSENSGSMNGVTNLETRWRALVPLLDETAGLWMGVAVHTLWNDLRGTTSFNQKTYGGYERNAAQLWLPIRWTGSQTWDIDAGFLIYGRHTSKLSQVNTSYTDIVNKQHHGQYAQVNLNLPMSSGDTLKPFVRYTHLGDSSVVTMNREPWIEPASHRWQIGAVWTFDTH